MLPELVKAYFFEKTRKALEYWNKKIFGRDIYVPPIQK